MYMCSHTERPIEPSECGHPVSEGESAGGAAAIQAAVGWPGDSGDQAAQPDQTTAAEPRWLLHQEPGAPGTHPFTDTEICRSHCIHVYHFSHNTVRIVQYKCSHQFKISINLNVFCVSRLSCRSVKKGWMNWRQSFRGLTTKSVTLVTYSTRWPSR